MNQILRPSSRHESLPSFKHVSKSPFRPGSRSPFRNEPPHLRRASKSPLYPRSRSPQKRGLKSPLRNAPRSPFRKTGKSPSRTSKSPSRITYLPPSKHQKHSSKSPFKRFSKSPDNKGPSVTKEVSSGLRRFSRSPGKRRSPFHSKSPSRNISRSPLGGRRKCSLRSASKSPIRKSRSPFNKSRGLKSGSPLRHRKFSQSPRRDRSESPYQAWLRKRIQQSLSPKPPRSRSKSLRRSRSCEKVKKYSHHNMSDAPMQGANKIEERNRNPNLRADFHLTQNNPVAGHHGPPMQNQLEAFSHSMKRQSHEFQSSVHLSERESHFPPHRGNFGKVTENARGPNNHEVPNRPFDDKHNYPPDRKNNAVSGDPGLHFDHRMHPRLMEQQPLNLNMDSMHRGGPPHSVESFPMHRQGPDEFTRNPYASACGPNNSRPGPHDTGFQRNVPPNHRGRMLEFGQDQRSGPHDHGFGPPDRRGMPPNIMHDHQGFRPGPPNLRQGPPHLRQDMPDRQFDNRHCPPGERHNPANVHDNMMFDNRQRPSDVRNHPGSGFPHIQQNMPHQRHPNVRSYPSGFDRHSPDAKQEQSHPQFRPDQRNVMHDDSRAMRNRDAMAYRGPPIQNSNKIDLRNQSNDRHEKMNDGSIQGKNISEHRLNRNRRNSPARGDYSQEGHARGRVSSDPFKSNYGKIENTSNQGNHSERQRLRVHTDVPSNEGHQHSNKTRSPNRRENLEKNPRSPGIHHKSQSNRYQSPSRSSGAHHNKHLDVDSFRDPDKRHKPNERKHKLHSESEIQTQSHEDSLAHRNRNSSSKLCEETPNEISLRKRKDFEKNKEGFRKENRGNVSEKVVTSSQKTHPSDHKRGSSRDRKAVEYKSNRTNHEKNSFKSDREQHENKTRDHKSSHGKSDRETRVDVQHSSHEKNKRDPANKPSKKSKQDAPFLPKTSKQEEYDSRDRRHSRFKHNKESSENQNDQKRSFSSHEEKHRENKHRSKERSGSRRRHLDPKQSKHGDVGHKSSKEKNNVSQPKSSQGDRDEDVKRKDCAPSNSNLKEEKGFMKAPNNWVEVPISHSKPDKTVTEDSTKEVDGEENSLALESTANTPSLSPSPASHDNIEDKEAKVKEFTHSNKKEETPQSLCTETEKELPDNPLHSMETNAADETTDPNESEILSQILPTEEDFKSQNDSFMDLDDKEEDDRRHKENVSKPKRTSSLKRRDESREKLNTRIDAAGVSSTKQESKDSSNKKSEARSKEHSSKETKPKHKSKKSTPSSSLDRSILKNSHNYDSSGERPEVRKKKKDKEKGRKLEKKLKKKRDKSPETSEHEVKSRSSKKKKKSKHREENESSKIKGAKKKKDKKKKSKKSKKLKRQSHDDSDGDREPSEKQGAFTSLYSSTFSTLSLITYFWCM